MRGSLLSLLVLAGVIGCAFYVGRCSSQPAESAVPNVKIVEKESPSVVVSMRALSRLEGAEFHMERIIDLRERQTMLRGLVEAEDALLLVAVGDVVAGVDLSGLIEADVEASETQHSVVLHLPQAQIFSARLDSSRTYVHSRKTDMLAERQEHLETKARARAEESLRGAAIEGGILSRAEESVRKSVTALLKSLGFESVEVRFEARDPSVPVSPPAR